MTDFTVEATVAAVTDGDWSELRRVIDLVPGTLLIEDAEEPVLIFPVQADSPTRALLFVDGVAKLVGLVICAGTVYPTPDVDYETPAEVDDEETTTPAVEAVNRWIDSVPPLDRRLTSDGAVEHV
jgi:hypothetical protein